MRCPNTPFATRLSGSAKETQLRIRSIFQWEKKRPPVWLFTLTAVAMLGCFSLVACREHDSGADEVLVLHPSGEHEIMVELEQIGKPFAQFADMEIKTIEIPDAAGQCMWDKQSGVGYYFFGTQGLPGLSYLTEEYSRRLRCAGVVSTVGEIFPEITERMPLDGFCRVLGIEDYTYGFEDRPDQGWLNFSWEGYTVWIDTDNPFIEQYDQADVVVDLDDVFLIVDDTIELENYMICDEYWNEIMMAEIMGGQYEK